MDYAIFDVDKTLIKNDCLLLAAKISNKKIPFLLSSIVFIPYYLLFLIRAISAKRLKEIFLKNFNICSLFNDKKNIFTQKKYKEELIKSIRKDALDRLNYHKERGDKIILCSASPNMLLEPLANYLDTDLLSTKLNKINSKWTPKIIGSNCNGKEKVKILEKNIGPLNKITFHAYGDSKGDKYMLEKSDFPHFKSFNNEVKHYPKFSINKVLPIYFLVLICYAIFIFSNYGLNFYEIIKNLKFEIFLGLSIITLGYLLRYIRWRLMLKALNLNPPIKKDFIAWMGSYAFTVTPGKAGEAIRSVLLKKSCNLPIYKTIVSIFMERISDGISVILILLINFSILNNLNIDLSYPIYLSLMVFFTYLIIRKFDLEKIISYQIKKFLPSKLKSYSIDSYDSFKKLLTLKLFIITTILGLSSWFCEGVSFWILLKGLYNFNISLGYATVAHTSAGLFGAISLLPGGIGTTEAGTAGILMLKGLTLKNAMTGTIVIRLMTLWYATFLGLVCFLLPFTKRNLE